MTIKKKALKVFSKIFSSRKSKSKYGMNFAETLKGLGTSSFFILSLFVLMLGIGGAKYQDYMNAPRPPQLLSKRNPSSVPTSSFVGGPQFLGRGIYDGVAGLGNFTIDLIKPLVIRSKLNGFLDGLTLKDDVKLRVKAMINSEKFMSQIVPFLMALKDLYMAPSVESQKNFENTIKAVLQPQDFPGLEHTLFTWKESIEAGASFNLDNEIITKIVNLYDVIFLQGGDYEFGMRPNRNMKVVERTTPVLKDFLQTVIGRMGGGETIGDVLEGVRTMMEDPERLETMSISLIDFISQTIYKHHQIFAEKLIRQKLRKDWMLQELDKKDQGDLWVELQKGQKEKRRAVHYVVDGLQGHLMEALSSGNAKLPFLQKVYEDHLKMQVPPTVLPEGATRAPSQSMTFLEYLVKEKEFQNPHYLPFFRQLYEKKNHGIVNMGIATSPTISVRNIPIAQTGAPVSGPGSTGLPNFHFLERPKDRAYYFYGNDSILLAPMAEDSGMKTMFERLTSSNSMNCHAPYDKGANYSLDGFFNLALGEKVRDFGEILCLNELERRSKNEIKAKALRQELLELHGILTSTSWFDSLGQIIQKQRARGLIEELSLLEGETMPDYLLFYSPWPDHFAHFKGPFSDEIISPTGELNRLDYWLGRIQKAYQTAGVDKNTIFGMAGDHGLTPVYTMLNPEEVVFKKLEKEKGLHFKIKKISSDEGEGPKLTHPLRPPSMKGYDVIVASTAGGNYMMDFFIDQGSNWGKQPLFQDLIALRTLEGAQINIVESILESLGNTLEYLAVRETPNDVNGGTVRLMSRNGEKIIVAKIIRQGKRIFYHSPEDLLGVKKLSPYEPALEENGRDQEVRNELLEKCLVSSEQDRTDTWCTEEEWRTLTSFSASPDSVGQMSLLYDNDRAGTVNLFPKEGIGYNTKVPGRHAGEHFHEKDAFVGLWGNNIESNSNTRVRTAVIGSVPATLYEYLTVSDVILGKDGWGFPSLLKEVSP